MRLYDAFSLKAGVRIPTRDVKSTATETRIGSLHGKTVRGVLRGKRRKIRPKGRRNSDTKPGAKESVSENGSS